MTITLQTAGDIAHTRTTGYRRRINDAREVIRDAIATGACVTSTSWGKDSTCLLHLVMQEAPSTRVLHLRWIGPGVMRPTGLDLVRDQSLTRYGLTAWVPDWEEPCGDYPYQPVTYHAPQRSTGHHHHCHSRSLPQLPPGSYLEVPIESPAPGWSLTAKGSRERGDYHAGQRRNGDRMRAAIQDLCGADTTIIGLRARESRQRAIHTATRGRVWRSSYFGLRSVAPIAYLTTQDVWGLIAEHDLPVSPHYHQSPVGRDRQRSELVEVQGAWHPNNAAAIQYATGMDNPW